MEKIQELIQTHKMKIGICVVVLMAVLFIYQSSFKKSVEPLETLATEKQTVEKVVTTEAPQKELMVDIKGAVKHPGVYPTQESQRVNDVIMLAVPRENADLEAVNLSMQLTDQMVIYVPFKGEVKEEKFTMYQNKSSTKTDPETKVVNINTATESELQEIPGIGPKKAADILHYREQHGGFKSKEEMKEIKGIGDKTYTSLEPFIEL
ncbi:comEA protein [Macrococcus brunensis]|uniref:ComEA protein n=1 Tax=Macrococcus brunensis TaxID=198483 RepID=A0A4R6BEF5_9STAP|nr:helix-hairpin-helix domain-containing protein [Macrococcus brunensis]TDL98162.1 comEA protein [Macrococcus brunensis]ULG71148.1 helix-hairpin-helix domain-containing protein [Macrococcus brunensis]ULG73483.1 helix-hairpin-helix domain-containing protein [Macrococcus brunensis]